MNEPGIPGCSAEAAIAEQDANDCDIADAPCSTEAGAIAEQDANDSDIVDADDAIGTLPFYWSFREQMRR